MKNLELSPLARADLDDIWSYIAQDSPEAADALLDAILDSMELLRDMPLIGRERPEFGPGRRSLAVEGYVLFYRPLQDRVRINRVLHGKRNITIDLL
jgi:toxin ParE1/3/4